jgi:hypothetical protein
MGDMTFTNVAFSKRLLSFYKNVGVVTITPQAFSIVGKKKRLTIDAPFVAELLHNETHRWPMVRVTQSDNTMLPAKVYLVVMGAPIEKRGKDITPALREVMREESMRLIAAINGSPYAPPRDDPAPPVHQPKALPKGAWFCIHCRNMNEDPQLTRCANCDRRRDGY